MVEYYYALHSTTPEIAVAAFIGGGLRADLNVTSNEWFPYRPKDTFYGISLKKLQKVAYTSHFTPLHRCPLLLRKLYGVPDYVNKAD